MSKIPLRKRFFLAVEGEGEQSFVKWLQKLADENKLHIHLDCQLLGGGGYSSMLKNTIHHRKRKERSRSPTILLVDTDRAGKDDGWSIEQLKAEAAKNKVDVCVQRPNQEGLLLRMFPGKENSQPNSSTIKKQLVNLWPNYKKPVDARSLASNFSITDLLRVAKHDTELKTLLCLLGLFS